jgi:hypothetical protein
MSFRKLSFKDKIEWLYDKVCCMMKDQANGGGGNITQDLQATLGYGNYADSPDGKTYLDFNLANGIAGYNQMNITSANYGAFFNQTHDGFLLRSTSDTTFERSEYRLNSGQLELFYKISAFQSTIGFNTPIAIARYNFPAKAAGTYTLATLDDITGGGAQDLQSVTNIGNSTTNDIFVTSGFGGSVLAPNFMKVEPTNGNFVETSILNGYPTLKLYKGGKGILLSSITPTEDRYVNFQDKDGTVAYLSDITAGGTPTGLEAVTESGKTGLRVIGRNPAQFADTGQDAVDFGTYFGSTSQGARGQSSFNIGEDNIANSYFAFTQGYLNTVTGNQSWGVGSSNVVPSQFSFAFGHTNTFGASGYYNMSVGARNLESSKYGASFGLGLINKQFGAVVVGQGNTDQGDTTLNVATAPHFIVGNGVAVAGTPNGVSTRSDAFIVRHNGIAELPSVTNTLIDAGTGKTVPTKEWVNVKVSGLEKLTEGGNAGWRLIGRKPPKYGNIGLQAVDFSDSIADSETLGATGQGALAAGVHVEASGNYSTSLGSNTLAKSYAETVVGVYSTSYTPISKIAFAGADRIFTVGNGVGDETRSNAFMVFKDGMVLAPSLTTTMIGAATGANNKVLITKEYGDAYYLGAIAATQFLRNDINSTKTAGNTTYNTNARIGFGTGNRSTLFSNGSETVLDMVTDDYFVVKNNGVTNFSFDRVAGVFAATNLSTQGLYTQGTGVGVNIISKLGNHDGSGSGTQVVVDDALKKVTLGDVDLVSNGLRIVVDNTTGQLTLGDDTKINVGTKISIDVQNDTILLDASKLSFAGIPTYADDKAADVGGLPSNMAYRTETGELRIRI